MPRAKRGEKRAARKAGGSRRTARRLACIFAHPDDETFATGGLLAKCTAEGVETALFCATNGDAGRSSDLPISSREELGAVRRNEVISAARFLGVRWMALPGYHDGILASVETDQLVGDIVLALRRWRPQVVVTFGPEGAPTGHRDHRAISRAATAAFFLAGIRTEYPGQLGELSAFRPQRLYYAAWRGGKGPRDPQLQSVPPTARIDVRSYLREQKAAFLLHATQRVHLTTFERDAFTRYEYFALAAGTPQRTPMVEDLFDGLR
jgi:LmbE family N-acetylglucosaminyl deacetylase